MGYVGRFAPSPTGPLHLGSLVAALGSYLDARHHNGRWLLRIEDLDGARVEAGRAGQIQRTLEDLGLLWDGAVEYQSARRALYERAIEVLGRRALTYACHCTRRTLAASADSAYPGTCRERPKGPGRAALRFRVDETQRVDFSDRFQGASSFALAALGDVVIRRRDDVVAYQLAVVVDDAEQGVTDVVRGADLLPSTGWQILLQRALELPTPRYGHLPIVVEPDGSKLAKSRRSLPIDPRRASGALIEALKLLRQAPPPSLAAEKPADVVAWALKHWNPANLERVQKALAPLPAP
jgi:glutamyl-Q tRNA(Asp) synthetase